LEGKKKDFVERERERERERGNSHVTHRVRIDGLEKQEVGGVTL
jgi:hypothetical protein